VPQAVTLSYVKNGYESLSVKGTGGGYDYTQSYSGYITLYICGGTGNQCDPPIGGADAADE